MSDTRKIVDRVKSFLTKRADDAGGDTGERIYLNGIKGTVYKPGELERHFFNELALPNKLKYFGTPEQGNYNGDRDHRDFFMEIPTIANASDIVDDDGTVGWFSRGPQGVHVSFRGEGEPSHFVHEHTHYKNLGPNGVKVDLDPRKDPHRRMVPMTPIPWYNWLIPRETEFDRIREAEKWQNEVVPNEFSMPTPALRELMSIYRFDRLPDGKFKTVQNAVPLKEATTSHAEKQLDFVKNFRDSMGHLPSPAEFEDFMDSRSLEELKREMAYVNNSYISEAITSGLREQAKKYNEEAYNKYREERDKVLEPYRTSYYDDKYYNDPRFSKYVEVLLPGAKRDTPWKKRMMGLADARKTAWYKENPELFEKLFTSSPRHLAAAGERLDHPFYTVGLHDKGQSVGFSPVSVLDTHRRLKRDEVLNAFEKAHPEPKDKEPWEYITDEEAERFRKAIKEIWSRNGQGSRNYNVV